MLAMPITTADTMAVEVSEGAKRVSERVGDQALMARVGYGCSVRRVGVGSRGAVNLTEDGKGLELDRRQGPRLVGLGHESVRLLVRLGAYGEAAGAKREDNAEG